MHEFELIRDYFAPLARGSDWLHAGIGEDCALLDGALFKGAQMVSSTDTLVEGRHFPDNLPNDMAERLARRVLGTAFSDLAACGATPLAFSMALSLPGIKKEWLAEFSKGLAGFIQDWSVELIGGDLSQGALCITVHAIGSVPAEQALRRDGARCGDALYLSGCTGEAAAALGLINDDLYATQPAHSKLLDRYWLPAPRFELGQRLRSVASAAIDISDGLLADAGHIADMSNCALRIEHEQVPLSQALRDTAAERSMDLALGGGDDYELLFTAPAGTEQEVQEIARLCQLPCTHIGSVESGHGIICSYKVKSPGWRHFG
jgi:thiamine-monophosphate kinase